MPRHTPCLITVTVVFITMHGISHVVLFSLVVLEDFNPGTLQVTFPVSSVEGDTVCGEIEAVDDDAFECSHDFTVAIGSATLGTTTGSPSEAVVTILDNDSERWILCV